MHQNGCHPVVVELRTACTPQWLLQNKGEGQDLGYRDLGGHATTTITAMVAVAVTSHHSGNSASNNYGCGYETCTTRHAMVVVESGPARPIIWSMSVMGKSTYRRVGASKYSVPLIIQRCAGKFTPQARVLVQITTWTRVRVRTIPGLGLGLSQARVLVQITTWTRARVR